jgi:hypothetical protein
MTYYFSIFYGFFFVDTLIKERIQTINRKPDNGLKILLPRWEDTGLNGPR